MAADKIVDFKQYGLDIKDISTVDQQVIASIGQQVVDNFQTYGFCYLKNHGINEELLNEYFSVSRTFYQQPEKEKEKYTMGSDYAFGWIKLERERFNQDRSAGDLHEAFNYVPGYCSNEVWPQVDRFESLTKRMHEVGTQLARRFCDVLSLGLGLPIEFMRNAHQKTFILRSLYYPPIKDDKMVAKDQARIGEHTDWGTITFNFQDTVGGLEVKTPEGEFKLVEPIPGTAIVTPSALLQRWTADKIKGAVHRILLDDVRGKIERQAVVVYTQPDDDVVIRCIDGSDKYEPITSKEYRLERAQHAE